MKAILDQPPLAHPHLAPQVGQKSNPPPLPVKDLNWTHSGEKSNKCNLALHRWSIDSLFVTSFSWFFVQDKIIFHWFKPRNARDCSQVPWRKQGEDLEPDLRGEGSTHHFLKTLLPSLKRFGFFCRYLRWESPSLILRSPSTAVVLSNSVSDPVWI